jgi:hypothetical protein
VAVYFSSLSKKRPKRSDYDDEKQQHDGLRMFPVVRVACQTPCDISNVISFGLITGPAVDLKHFYDKFQKIQT